MHQPPRDNGSAPGAMSQGYWYNVLGDGVLAEGDVLEEEEEEEEEEKEEAICNPVRSTCSWYDSPIERGRFVQKQSSPVPHWECADSKGRHTYHEPVLVVRLGG